MLSRQIFESFYTSKGPGEGTGLGMAIRRVIITRHKGTIAVDTVNLPALSAQNR